MPPAPTARRRDAAATRTRLLEAARRRFALDGYTATTVRDIADDAGVNVALISRYFASKEGLFEECLRTAVGTTSRAAEQVSTLADVAAALARRASDAASDEGLPHVLLLLLRSSGDERAEGLRTAALRALSERLAASAGWSPDGAAGADGPGGRGADELLLRSQVVLATALGIAVLRTRGRLEPLASADEDALGGPLHDLVEALLGPGPPGAPGGAAGRAP